MGLKSILLGAACSAILALPASAARLAHWYGAVEGGGIWVQDFELQEYLEPLGPPPSTSVLELDQGWLGLGAIGYSFENYWRFEIEGGYRHSNFATLTPLGGLPSSAEGELGQYTLMANALYDFTSPSGVTFSIGAGAGADYARLKSPSLTTAFRGDDVSIAFQAIAGLSVPLSDWLHLALNYRYLYAPQINLVDENVVAPGLAHVDFGEVHKHAVTLGLRIGGSAPEEAPTAAAPPPPPPPPPVARQFVVFFGFNKCNITPSADQVLSEAASSARQVGSASITISGHTDSVGSPQANLKLSDCRANAAKQNLIGKGVNASTIQTYALGETQLLIQTGDGVKEPQNRRATVDLQ